MQPGERNPMKKLVLTTAVILMVSQSHAKDAEVCPMDATQCPAGSYVSHHGPQCKFVPCSGQPSGAEIQSPVYMPMILERVIDGDTIHASGRTIRLWGIDTPEKGEPFYEHANLAMHLFLDGADLMCKQVDIDRYQRDVMHCLVDKADLGSLMVKTGWAKDYTTYSGGFYQTEEAYAKRELLGIWKTDD